jgi:hypothetical protein
MVRLAALWSRAAPAVLAPQLREATVGPGLKTVQVAVKVAAAEAEPEARSAMAQQAAQVQETYRVVQQNKPAEVAVVATVADRREATPHQALVTQAAQEVIMLGASEVVLELLPYLHPELLVVVAAVVADLQT